MISINSLTFGYRANQPLFNNLSLTINKGDLLVILGPNGSGKSTFLECLCGLHKYQGVVAINGTDIKKMGERNFSKNVAFVPQKISSECRFDVLDFIVMGRNPYISYLKPNHIDYEIASKYMCEMGLERYAHRELCKLSGGERQRAYIARCLAQETNIIIFDEPTSALDYNSQYSFLKLLKQLSLKGYTIIMSTHDPNHPFVLNSKVGLLCNSEKFILGQCSEPSILEEMSRLYGDSMEIKKINQRNICLLKEV